MSDVIAPPKRRFFDNTMLSGYKKCPRYYFLRHRKHWRKEGLSGALAFGLSWHSAQDVVWSHYGRVSLQELCQMAQAQFEQVWEEQGMPLDLSLEDVERLSPRLPGTARQMLEGYVEARYNILEQSNLIACEQPFAVPLPIRSEDVTSVWYAGRLDKVVEYNGQTIVVEHKTTTEYAKASGFKTSYTESWYLDSQVMGYLYGGGLYYSGLEQVWVDAALVHKQVHDKFRFIPVGHQWNMLESWVQDTKDWVARILRDEVRYELNGGSLAGGVFPKNQESCMGKYGACAMLDVCRTQPFPEKMETPPAGYIVEVWEPFEILKLDTILNKEPM